jgi:hypothetical protein
MPNTGSENLRLDPGTKTQKDNVKVYVAAFSCFFRKIQNKESMASRTYKTPHSRCRTSILHLSTSYSLLQKVSGMECMEKAFSKKKNLKKTTPWLVMICCPENDLGLMDIEEARPTSDVFVWLPICSLQNGTHVPTMKNSWYLKKPT